MAKEAFIELGKIASYYGVRGWVKLFSYTRPRSAINDYQRFYIGDEKLEVSFDQIKSHGKYIIGHITGAQNREDIGHLMGQTLFVKREDLPALQTGEYYWADLIGLEVINQSGQSLGHISRLMETGANDVLVISRGNASNQQTAAEILIPYVLNHFVLSIDLASNIMRVDWEDDAD